MNGFVHRFSSAKYGYEKVIVSTPPQKDTGAMVIFVFILTNNLYELS
jgi:hypothetical protein